MVSYSAFAITLSAVVVVQYLALLIIALRRAGFDERQAERAKLPNPIAIVKTHARFVEGPVVTVLFLVAILVGVPSLLIGSADYSAVAGLAIASIRGGLFFLGWWLLGWYWRERQTWM